jgi:hypothetical protein
MRSWSAFVAIGLGACVAGCSGGDDGDPFGSGSATASGSATTPGTDGTSSPTTTITATATGTSDVTTEDTSQDTTTGAASSSEDTGGGPKLDVGAMGTTGAQEPCRKVDVILAVDASSSMEGVIEDLQGTFNGWVGDLLTEVGDDGIEDFQLAVIDGCDESPYFHDTNDSTGACNFSTGANFMVSDSAALGAEFTCVSDTRSSSYMAMPDACDGDNDDEDMAAAAAAAVTFPAESTQNTGFLRDDAVLFVVAITNEDEGGFPSGANPQMIHDALVNAKGGEVNNVVFLGVGAASVCFAYGEFTVAAAQLEALAGLFEADSRGVFYDLCQENLVGAFDEAIQLVDSACDDFVPEG